MSDPAMSWLVVCRVEDIDEEDVIQFEYGGKIFAIYHTPSGFYATDGICTHENAYLAGGPRGRGDHRVPKTSRAFPHSYRQSQGSPGLRKSTNLSHQGRGGSDSRRSSHLPALRFGRGPFWKNQHGADR